MSCRDDVPDSSSGYPQVQTECDMKGKKALKTYSYKEFKELLGTLGFYEHHKNSTHMVFANEERRYVTVPFSNKKEINPMMTTVTLQRIKNHQCRIL